MSIKLVNDVDALIAAAHKGSGVFAQLLHEAAFNCIHLVDNNGDVRPLNRLYEKLAPAAQNALKAWAVHFGRVKFDADLLGFKLNRSIDAVDPELVTERELVGPMEYVRTPKPAVKKTFNLVREIVRLCDKAEKEGYASHPKLRALIALANG